MNPTDNSRDTTQDELIDMWTRGTDRQVVPPPTPTMPYDAPVLRPAGRASVQMAIGFCLFAVGVGVTSATYDAASGGGHYIIATGPIVYGVILFFRGLANALRR